MNKKNISNNLSNVKYIALETEIPYDWDDYDLYCDIFLDMSTGKIVNKYYGHGSYDTFPKEEIMPYNKAIELGVVTSEYIKNAIYHELFEPYYTEGKLSNIYFVANCSKNVCIPCFVNGGRKFRGSGIFVGITSKYNYYSHYNDFTYWIADPISKTISSVNPKFIDVTSIDDIKEKIHRNVISYDNLGKIMQRLAYKVSLYGCDTKYLEALRDKIAFSKPFFDIDINEFENIDEKKNKEKKRKEMERWAHNKFDGIKTKEEIEKIINKTFEKYSK